MELVGAKCAYFFVSVLFISELCIRVVFFSRCIFQEYHTCLDFRFLNLLFFAVFCIKTVLSRALSCTLEKISALLHVSES